MFSSFRRHKECGGENWGTQTHYGLRDVTCTWTEALPETLACRLPRGDEEWGGGASVFISAERRFTLCSMAISLCAEIRHRSSLRGTSKIDAFLVVKLQLRAIEQ